MKKTIRFGYGIGTRIGAAILFVRGRRGGR